MTPAQFANILGCSPSVSAVWHLEFEKVFDRWDIREPIQQAHFLAQVGHETGGLRQFSENLNYKADQLMRVWPKRFPTVAVAEMYAGHPERIANLVYRDRYGNGSYESGDGWKFRGRGAFQVTFKDNYLVCGRALKLDLVSDPDLLLQPEHAAMSAGWYWSLRGLNKIALTGDCDAVSDVINIGKQTAKQGDSNGFADRKRRTDNALKVLS